MFQMSSGDVGTGLLYHYLQAPQRSPRPLGVLAFMVFTVTVTMHLFDKDGCKLKIPNTMIN